MPDEGLDCLAGNTPQGGRASRCASCRDVDVEHLGCTFDVEFIGRERALGSSSGSG